jgi:RNase P subunit RPR2
MANKWHCDSCGKETMLNPPVEPLFEDEEKTKPKLSFINTMVFASGRMVSRQVQATKDLSPRCYIVKLNCGPAQTIQRDYCEDCYKLMLPEINALWKKLESFGVK